MVILQIEHRVQNYDGWKKAFDNDPIDRKKSGVKRYRVYRPTDDRDYVIVDLEFDDFAHATKALHALNVLWGNVEGKVIFSPKHRILDITDSREY